MYISGVSVIHVVNQHHVNIFSSIINHTLFYLENHNCHSENPFEISEMSQPFRLAFKLTSRLNSSVKLVSICSLFMALINQ